MSVAERVPAAGVVLPSCALAVAVLAWWAVVVTFSIPDFLLPSPVAVAAQLTESPKLFAVNAWITFERIAIGGTVGIVSGFCLAVLVSHVSWLRRALVPYLVTVRVLPTIAVAPLLLIYYGTGFTTGVIFVALITFFPMVVSTTAGLARVPARYLDLLDSVNAGSRKAFLHVRLPHALPDVFAGLKQSVTLAVIGAV
ncbi:MAG TPA: ABC transporter permease subunit, partial [Halococcus sp.]|nr:ABC transporter permease subunit [Halococcus sp.]